MKMPLWFLPALMLTTLGVGTPAMATVADITAFGASPSNTPAQNVTDIHAALASLPATGGELYIPAGTYKIDAQINVTKSIVIRGEGPCSDSQGVGSVLQLNNATQNGLVVTTVSAPITIRDICMTSSRVGGQTGGDAIQIGATPNMSPYPFRIDNVSIEDSYRGIHIVTGAYYTISNCFLNRFTSIGVYVQNTINNDEGDGTVTGTVLYGNAGAVNVYLESGGGLRFVNNKLLDGGWGLYLNRLGTSATSDLVIAGNSLEGATTAEVALDRTSGSLTFNNVVIAGNQLASNGTAYGVVVIPTTTFITSIVISGNSFNNWAAHVSLSSGSGVVIDGNHFVNGTQAIGITTTPTGTIGANRFDSVTTPIAMNAGGSVNVAGGVLSAAQLPNAPNGSFVGCSNCTNTCAGGGNGALARRVGGVWVCS